MYARQTLAVASGRKLVELSSRSSKLYISFETMSVSPPTARANNSVGSKMGGRISPKPKVPKISRAVPSTRFHSAVSGGRRSRVPRIAWNLDLVATRKERFSSPGVLAGSAVPASLGRMKARRKNDKRKSARFRSFATSRFCSVDVFVLDVAASIHLDGGLIDGGESAFHFSRRTHHQTPRRN